MIESKSARKKPYSIALAVSRLAIFTGWCVIGPFYFYLAKLMGYRRLDKIPMQFHRGCCRILPLTTSVEGEPSNHRATLYISNHVSYLDIFVLGSLVPGCFIAKSEVAGWPVLGRMARIQNTLFFERKSRHAHSQIEVMAKQLSTKGNLILFPEGTSTDGTYVEPFKSSLFHAAEIAEEVLIQPITIAYLTHRGQPMEKSIRDYFAWYAEMPFASHFFKMAGMRAAQTKLIFHTPVKLTDFESRKACAEHCQRKVSSALSQALSHLSPAGVNAGSPATTQTEQNPSS